MTAIMTGCTLVFFVAIAFWRFNPVLFMIAGAVALMAACYGAEIVGGGVTTNPSITLSLCLFALWLTCWAFAFWSMFTTLQEEKDNG